MRIKLKKITPIVEENDCNFTCVKCRMPQPDHEYLYKFGLGWGVSDHAWYCEKHFQIQEKKYKGDRSRV